MVLEIQACMPSPPKTFGPYMRGVYIAYIVVSWAYFGVAFTGAQLVWRHSHLARRACSRACGARLLFLLSLAL